MRYSYILCCLLFYITGYNQEALKFINYTTVNGLADNRVGCITQDSRGFMWFGTSEGLSRFDGNKFENYFADPRTKNSLPDNMIVSVNEYKPGHLLILTGTHLSCLNTFTRQFYYPSFAPGKKIYLVSKAGDSGYIICSIDTAFLVNRELKITDTLLSPFGTKTGYIAAWYLDKDLFLLGRSNEYYLYHRSTGKHTILIRESDIPWKEKILSFQYFDPVRRILYFTNYFGGIYQYDLSGKPVYHWPLNQPLPFHSGNIRFITPKNDSILWIGNGEDQGIAIFNRHSNRFSLLKSDKDKPASLISNAVMTTYTDRDGNDWIGTTSGISKINNTVPAIKKWETGTVAANSPFLSIIKGTDDNFYVAKFGVPHIWKINRDDERITEVKNGQFPGVWCLGNFGNSIIVTGGGTATVQYDPLTKKISRTDFLKEYYPETDIVVLAFKHSNGDEWYSGNAGGGFVRISAKDKTIHHYKKDGPAGSFNTSYYPYHAEDKNGYLLFGVNKTDRLLHWSRQKQRFDEILFINISNTQNTIFRGITELLADRHGNIWTGFDGSGIVKYDPVKNETFHYTIANGLASNYISSMAFDDKDRLWVGTFKGLTCFITTENKFITFTRKDGLPDDYFADRCILYDSSTHLLWIGGSTALMRFDPDEILKTSSRKFPVYIDGVLVNNKLFVDQTSVNTSLAPGQNNLQFSFIGLNPETGTNIEYSYKLTGADKEWVSNNTTTAAYNNLGPGDYTFMVRARHKGDIEWMTLEQPFSFTIGTPWYKTWWFRIALIAAAIALSWFIIRTYYKNKFLRQKAMMEKEIAIEQERTKMARELHDGLGSMLSGIKHSFAAMTKEFDLNDNQKLLFHSNLDKLNESIKELRNISHNMASDALLKYGLENSLRDYCSNASLNSGIPVSFTALNTKDLDLGEERSVHIFRIIQELFQNIIKHSEARNVLVQLSYNNNQLYVTVEDNGKGFDMTGAKKQDGIGLKNIESRIRILKGDLDYKTEPGKGTSVLITIPVD